MLGSCEKVEECKWTVLDTKCPAELTDGKMEEIVERSAELLLEVSGRFSEKRNIAVKLYLNKSFEVAGCWQEYDKRLNEDPEEEVWLTVKITSYKEDYFVIDFLDEEGKVVIPSFSPNLPLRDELWNFRIELTEKLTAYWRKNWNDCCSIALSSRTLEDSAIKVAEFCKSISPGDKASHDLWLFYQGDQPGSDQSSIRWTNQSFESNNAGQSRGDMIGGFVYKILFRATPVGGGQDWQVQVYGLSGGKRNLLSAAQNKKQYPAR